MISEKEMMIVDAVNASKCKPKNIGLRSPKTHVSLLGEGRIPYKERQVHFTVGGISSKYWSSVCTIEKFNQCIAEMSEGDFAPNASKAVKAKTVTVKVMLFDKPYEFTVCYYTETFELVSAFENKMNQSVMWSQPIKDLIVNELKNGVEELSRITQDDKFPLYNAYRDNVNAHRELRG